MFNAMERLSERRSDSRWKITVCLAFLLICYLEDFNMVLAVILALLIYLVYGQGQQIDDLRAELAELKAKK